MRLEDIRKIGIAGGGTMGSGIAQVFAQNGYEVVILDLNEKLLDNAKRIIMLNQKTLVDEGLLTEEKAEESLKCTSYSTDYSVFADVDLISESIIEKLDIKQEFWRRMDEIAKEDCIFTTNTSGISINAVGEKIKDKCRFMGMHFVNPPHIIPLVELIKSNGTSDEIVQTIRELLNKVGKRSVVSLKDVSGFIYNRLQFAIYREALNLVESGISTVEDIDTLMKYGLAFRWATVGPFETADLGGLDTFYHISSYLFNELSDVKKPTKLQQELIDNNNLGVKSGRGWYDYSDGKGEEAMARRDKKLLEMLKYMYKEEE